MLNTVFYIVLNMSITASVIGCILIVLRAFFGNRLPKLAVYSSWSLVLIRMFLPFSIGSEMSLINILKGYLVKTVKISKPSVQLPDVSMLNSVKAASEYFPVEYKTRALESIFTITGIVWISGVVLAACVSTGFYFIIASQLSKSVLFNQKYNLDSCKERLGMKSNVRVFTNHITSTPLVFGVFAPKIIIPTFIEEKNLEFILLHELIHIRRKDNLWKLIGVFAACLHWFNPFTWIFLYISGEDMELACDSKVLSYLDSRERKQYARSLAHAAIKQHAMLPAFGGISTKHRILNAMSYKRISIFMTIITSGLQIILIFMLLTNPL